LEEGVAFSQALIHQGISSLGFLNLWVQCGYSLVVDVAVKGGHVEIDGIFMLDREFLDGSAAVFVIQQKIKGSDTSSAPAGHLPL